MTFQKKLEDRRFLELNSTRFIISKSNLKVSIQAMPRDGHIFDFRSQLHSIFGNTIQRLFDTVPYYINKEFNY